jgi:hypothetical protein
MLNTLLAVAQKEKMNNVGTHPTFFLKIWDVSLYFTLPSLWRWIFIIETKFFFTQKNI